MTQELYEVLEALCDMWGQYCGGDWGHYCMSAGENCEEVLDKYNLLIHGKGYAADVNYPKLEELKSSIPQPQPITGETPNGSNSILNTEK